MIKIVVIALMLGAALVAVIGIAFISSRKRVGEMKTERMVIESTAAPSPDPSLMRRGNSEEELWLVVDSPVDSTEITGTKVNVIGRTVPGADVAVNEMDVKADNKGNFAVMIEVVEGENLIVVMANDEMGRQAEREIRIEVAYSTQDYE